MDAIESVVGMIAAQWFENYILQTASGAVIAGYDSGREEAIARLQVDAVEYSAIMDEAVCPACEALDGMLIDLRTEEGMQLYDKFAPAQHENCRCIMIGLGEGDMAIPETVGGDNAQFEQNFVDKYNQYNQTDLSLSQIASAHMSHNVNWPYYDYDPWEKERKEIENERKQKAQSYYDQEYKRMYDLMYAVIGGPEEDEEIE